MALNGLRDGVEWAARLSGVREVSLEGTADLGFWTRHLAPFGVRPARSGGRARLLIVAAGARFAGIRFRELSVSVILADEGSAFLLQAFNSSRLFAFCERAFFATPYLHGEVAVGLEPAPFLGLRRSGTEPFRAEMRGDAPSPAGISGWEGRVLVQPPEGGRRRCFFARIHGATETRPFEPSDHFSLGPLPGVPLFDLLIDSAYAPSHWSVRRSAVHMKSKTYER